jgi:hypothetical protein
MEELLRTLENVGHSRGPRDGIMTQSLFDASSLAAISFITYRIAKVKSAEQVALEAGNLPSIIFKNYRELATEEQADEWFGILPKDGQWENAYQWDHRARIVTLPGQEESFGPRVRQFYLWYQ